MVDRIRILPQTNYNSGSEVSLIFDSVTEFTPNKNKRVTQYITSDKMTITNNQVRGNPTLTMKGRVSKYPLEIYTNNLVDGGDNLSGRIVTAHDILDSWYERGIDLYIDAGYTGYSKYTLSSIEPLEDTTESLIFSLKFEKIRRTTYERVLLIQNMSESKELDGVPNGGGGKDKTSDERISQITLSIQDAAIYAKQNRQESLAKSLDSLGKLYDDKYVPSDEVDKIKDTE